ncbi:MAG: L,D-transpeptidase [Caldilineaceae bacterium]|nr:L,D-transpeptidase [Caldilineaceae bacterium]
MRKQIRVVLLGLLMALCTGGMTLYAADSTPPRPIDVIGDAASPSLLPPLPFAKASMDLPRFHKEKAEVKRSQQSLPEAKVEEEESISSPVQLAAPTIESVEEARSNGQKWIEVNLTEQKTYAWEGDQLAGEFLISSGLPGTPTVQGVFRMRVRTRSQTMSGGDRAAGTYYSLPNVEWVQYFYADYSFHGTYWHNNFGHPMSHGCVNMTNEDAEWLFRWSMPEYAGETRWLSATEDNALLVYIHE